jgi:diguanylate cyclase (GGDEF)-like protein
LDVDHFKSVNDAFGHAHGDRVLTEFAARLRGMARAVDIVFRYGGDEFLVIVPHADRAQAGAFAEQILQATISRPFSGNPPLSMSVSIGVAIFPQDGETPEGLFEAADRRHYRAKREGRARVITEDRVYTPDLDSLPEEPSRLIERDLAMETVYRFLDLLPERKRGVLAVNGPQGVGKTRFLAEARKIARLRGYAMLSLTGRAAIKPRFLGALDLARQEWSDLPAPTDQPMFENALRQQLERKQYLGWLILLDRPSEMDRATLDAVRAWFGAQTLPVLGILYTESGDALYNQGVSFPLPPNDHSLRDSVILHPISLNGLRIWVRHSLHWEPPQEFLDWLHGETAGLPSLIQAGLVYITEHGLALAREHNRQLSTDLTRLPLGRELSRWTIAPCHNLPLSLTSFVGREAELRQLKRLLQEHRLVTLTGPDGFGKTRLALQAAAEIMDSFPGGMIFRAVGESTLGGAAKSSEEVIPQGSDPWRDCTPSQAIESARRSLLILDDASPLPGLFRQIPQWIAQFPALTVLLTTQQRLGLDGEVVMPLGGMTCPAGILSGDIQHCAAGQLFIQRARQARYDFSLTEADHPALEHICRVTGGAPLALEMAAAWVQAFSLAEIARRVETRTDLTAGCDANPSASAAFGMLRGIFSHPEIEQLRRLAHLPDPFEAALAAEKAGASLFFLDALAGRSLLRCVSETRFSFHPLLRKYLQGEIE